MADAPTEPDNEKANNPPSVKGILISAAFVIATIFILSETRDNLTVPFTRAGLPKFLADKMPKEYEAVFVTSTYTTSTTDWEPLTLKSFGAIAWNMFPFGRRNQ